MILEIGKPKIIVQLIENRKVQVCFNVVFNIIFEPRSLGVSKTPKGKYINIISEVFALDI